MIIDFHNHIGKDVDGGEQTVDDLLTSMHTYNIDYAVVFPFSASPEEMIQQSVKLLKAHHPKIIPFLRLHPEHSTKEQLITLLDKGFKGVKLHPEAQKFYPHVKELDWFYQELQRRKLPVLIHCKKSDTYSKPEFLLTIARKFPQLPVIIAHFFGDCFVTMKESVALPNVYSEVSIFGRTLRVNQIVQQGFTRLLFGSDSPYDDQEAALLKVTKAKLPKVAQQQVLGLAAKNLLGI